MSLPLKRDSRFHQGVYQPKNKEKFIGTEAIFRSGLELKFFRFCDGNPKVLKWGSENVKVPYFDTQEKKNRTYYVDNFVMIREGDQVTKYLIEIKPFKQTKEPKDTGKRKKSHLLYEQQMYKNNQDKWNAARAFAKKCGMKFLIITEKDLNT